MCIMSPNIDRNLGRPESQRSLHGRHVHVHPILVFRSCRRLSLIRHSGVKGVLAQGDHGVVRVRLLELDLDVHRWLPWRVQG